MVSFRSILAAGCLSSIVVGAPLPTSVNQLFARSSYVVYGGTGALSEGWPARSSWVSFDTMWSANQGILTSGCGWSADQLPENSPSEVSQLKSAIQSVSSSSGVDSRFILAIVLQESNGCVRVHSTDNGVANPGVMQSHRGTGTCNIGSNKQVPCPEANIVQMIKDGTVGTAAGDGLVGVLQKSGASDDSKFYKAARIYNSGSIAASKNIGDGNGATPCYSSDIANRLMGYAGNTGCDASVATLSRTAGSVDSAPVADTPAVETTSVSTPVETPVSNNPGGVFAELPSTPTTTPVVEAPAPTQAPPVVEAPASSTQAPPVAVAPSPTSIVVVQPTESTNPTPPVADIPTSTSNPTSETVTVLPVPVTSPPSATPETTTPEPSTPVSEPSTPAAGAQTPGSPCPEEGTWNCIAGSTFQQCASGIWSATQSLAAGTECEAGMSKVFTVTALKH